MKKPPKKQKAEPSQDERISAAYQECCRREANKILYGLWGLKAFVIDNKDIHHTQPKAFKAAMDNVLGIEGDLLAITGGGSMTICNDLVLEPPFTKRHRTDAARR